MSSFRSEMVERRVPHILAVYAGLSWGFVQFIDFIERYGISPHWTDLALIALLLLLPSVALFAYNHGRPGKDEWTGLEKLGIPLNVVLAGVVLFLLFQGKAMGMVTRQITLLDESGKQVEREVANASFRRRVAVFNFDGPADDTAVAWLRYALPLGIAADLSQDMFMDVRYSSYFREKLRQMGHADELNVPFGMKRVVALEQHLPYFTEGKVSRNAGQYVIELALYESADGKLAERHTYQGSDVFALIDEISAGLKKDLGTPKTGKVQDLPVSSVLTSSLPAFRSYSDGAVAVQVRDQWPPAIELLEKAVALDSTFAAAFMTLHNVYLLANQAQRSMPPLQKAMDNLYRLPEAHQFVVKAEYYTMKQDHERAYAVAKMNTELFPEDVNSYALLSQMQRLRDDKPGMIASFEKMLELDPSRQELLRQLGSLEQARGEFGNALRYLSQYAERFPDKPDNFISIGNLHRLQGNRDQAKANYERALILSDQNVGALTGLARVERDGGELDAALRHYEQAVAAAKTSEDKARAIQGMADYYAFRGELRRSLRSAEQARQERARIQAPVQTAMEQLGTLDLYVKAGETATAERIARGVKAQLQPPFDGFSALGDLQMNVALERPDQAEAAAASIERLIQTMGFKLLQGIVTESRGRIAELRGQCDQAIAKYEEVLKLEPTSFVMHTHIARCYRKLNQPQKAIEQALLTLKVIPFDPRANYEIGLAYSAAGDRAKALEHLQRAELVWKDADPAYQLASEMKAEMQKLQATK